MNQKSLEYFFIYLPYVPLAMLLTISGLYVVDKNYGYHAFLKYNNEIVLCDSVSRLRPGNQKYLIEKKYPLETKAGLDFPEKEKYLSMIAKARKEDITYGLCSIGFLLSVASIGCIALLLRLKWQTLYIMLASMWAFEPLRLLFYLLPNLIIAKFENLLSEALNLHSWFLIIVLSIIGLTVSFFILKKIYKAGELKSFLIGSLLGAPVGMFLWLEVIGPFILP